MSGVWKFARHLTLVLACGCTGVITGPLEETGSEPQVAPDGSLPYVAPPPASGVLQARTWKLTHEQYRRSLEQVLGVPVSLTDADGLPRLQPEIDSGVFRNMALASFVSVPLAEDYYRVAEELTDALDDDALRALIPCGEIRASCRDEFLRRAIRTAFRRPATDEDLTRFAALFDLAQGAAEVLGDPAAGFRAALQGILTSPYFLYRTEIGDDPAQRDFELTDYEVASFLSYSLLGEPPDAELLAAADRGELTSASALPGLVQALLAEPAAALQLREFLLEWLEVIHFLDPEIVRKDLASFDGIRPAMWAETLDFLDRHADMTGDLTSLLTTPAPLPSGPLGEFYLSGPTSDSADRTRTGVLALGTLLATNAKEGATSPTLRGVFLRERFLCQDFVELPNVPDINDTAEREQPRTTRELYEFHASIPSCAACHDLIDGTGMTFESLDEVGRFRGAENGVPVDTSGKLLQTDVDTELRDHTQLAEALAQSEWVRECLSRQAFRFYFGLATSGERTVDGTLERENRGMPPIQAGRAALGRGGSFGELVAALVTSPSTLQRTRFEPPSAFGAADSP